MKRTTYADTAVISDLKGTADIIEEVSDTLVYFGFCEKGTTATSDDKWSIMRITISGNVNPVITTFQWAGGMCSFNYKWDDRAGLTYAFKKF